MFKIIYFLSNLCLTSSLNYFKNFETCIKRIFIYIIDDVKTIDDCFVILKIIK